MQGPLTLLLTVPVSSRLEAPLVFSGHNFMDGEILTSGEAFEPVFDPR